jgi:hypothetical protein
VSPCKRSTESAAAATGGERHLERRRVPDRLVVADHALLTERAHQELVRVVLGRVVDRKNTEGGIRLGCEGVQALAECGVGRTHDEDAEDRRAMRRCVVLL